MIQAYHFTSDTLRDGSSIPAVGEWLRYAGEVRICSSGLHASRCPLDALRYAPGALLHGVTCDGIEVEQSDKLVCRSRRIDWTLAATPMLRAFARWCALQVARQWDAPPVVLDYLTTGREGTRAAAEAAAWAAAEAAWAAAKAAWAAAKAAKAAEAAEAAAWAAAKAAAWAAAWDAAWAAAWDAARTAQRTQLLTMIDEARAGRTEWTFEVPVVPQ